MFMIWNLFLGNSPPTQVCCDASEILRGQCSMLGSFAELLTQCTKFDRLRALPDGQPAELFHV